LESQDLPLIAALQADPRARAVQLGERIGMSAPTVSTRLRALIDRGAVEVVGIVDYRALATSALAIALVRGLAPEVLTTVPDRRGVVFAVQTIGSADAAVSFVDSDIHGIERHLEWLRARSLAVEVHHVLDIAVTGLPRREPVTLRDALDEDIACLLAVDARASFTSIAEGLGVPEATARSRAQRLLDGHVVTPLVIPQPALFGLHAAAALGIEVSAPAVDVLAVLAGIPGVITTLHTQGRFAAVVELIAPDTAAVARSRDAILAIPGVRDVEVYSYGARYIGRQPLPDRGHTPVVDRG
jgi:DNA-binding Lrp family transcriptional regulator